MNHDKCDDLRSDKKLNSCFPSLASILCNFDKNILCLWIHPCLDVITQLKVLMFPPLNSHSLIQIADVGWCVFLIRICTQMIPACWYKNHLFEQLMLIEINTWEVSGCKYPVHGYQHMGAPMSGDSFRLLNKFDYDSSGQSLRRGLCFTRVIISIRSRG